MPARQRDANASEHRALAEGFLQVAVVPQHSTSFYSWQLPPVQGHEFSLGQNIYLDLLRTLNHAHPSWLLM